VGESEEIEMTRGAECGKSVAFLAIVLGGLFGFVGVATRVEVFEAARKIDLSLY
jgi:hypothetical protein